MEKLIIYTDGSCRGNGKAENTGGYGFIILNNEEEVLVKVGKQEFNTTNNRMEMMAIIHGISAALCCLKSSDFSLEIYTDSAYVHNCKSQKWYKSWESNDWKNSKKEPVKNQDLWKLLIFFFEDSRFSFNKVKGHAGNKYNEIVDKLAVAASDGNETEEGVTWKKNESSCS